MPNKTTGQYYVLLAAAGAGQRLGANLPKQYLKINGKSILRHTIDHILNTWPGNPMIRVIIDPEHADLYHDAVQGLTLSNPIHGGKSRKYSISNGLNSISKAKNEDIILVHDAARPFAKARDIQALLEAMKTNKAASLATPVSDTLRNAEGIIDRNGLWSLQTPQAFYFSTLKQAHEHAPTDQEHTDDTSLVSALGTEIKLIEASRANIKITTQDDLAMAKALLSENMEMRTGLGFDVHAFDTEHTEKPLILCGIKIEHDAPLKGHSDADVGLHALTDAILGAIGEGDIGQHFPPSDNTFKDMDSAIFLKKAMAMLTAKNGALQNLDLTIICEAPKIGPHSNAMKNYIANIIDIDPSRINIKATTTEQLGFTGRKEGIAAQAIATIKLPVL